MKLKECHDNNNNSNIMLHNSNLHSNINGSTIMASSIKVNDCRANSIDSAKLSFAVLLNSEIIHSTLSVLASSGARQLQNDNINFNEIIVTFSPTHLLGIEQFTVCKPGSDSGPIVFNN